MKKMFIETITNTTKEFNKVVEKKRLFEQREKICQKLLDESYGSFKGQYQSIKNITNEIIRKYNNYEYISDGKKVIIKASGNVIGVGNVNLFVYWSLFDGDTDIVSGESTVDDNNTLTVTLNVKKGKTPYYNISSTMAHEIMHCFQIKLPKVKDVNVNSMILYKYLPSFFRVAPLFSYYFFYGMYITFFIERTANISSVSNFMEEYFKGKDKETITTLEYQNAIEKCDKYQIYEEVLRNLKNIPIELKDVEYINKCLTRTFKNMYDNNKDIVLFNPQTFNVEVYISKKKEEIIKLCQETIEKMYKNIINFIEN